MMIQKLQEIHHMSGELLQEMGQMGQRETYMMPHQMGQRDYGQIPNYNQGGNGGMNQRAPQYLDPYLY